MKIGLILTPSYFPTLCGMTYASHTHAQILKSLGIETHIITGTNNIDGESQSTENGITIHRIMIKGSGLPWSPVKEKNNSLENKIRLINPDFIISEGWHTWGTHWFINKKMHNCKYILSSHGSSQGEITLNLPRLIKWIGYKFYDKITNEKILKNLDGAILLSTYEDNKRFRDQKLFKKHKIPLYIIANTSIFSANEINPKKLNKIIHIGEMGKNKNQKKALEIFMEARKKIPIKLEFIYPSDNKYHLELKRKVKDYKLCNDVNFVKGLPREKLENNIESSSIILVTSITEAQPISVIDAQAFGIPFVSTSVGCLPSMQGGICSSYKDMPNLLVNILTKEGLYKELSKAAYKNNLENHSFNYAKATFKKMLSDVCH